MMNPESNRLSSNKLNVLQKSFVQISTMHGKMITSWHGYIVHIAGHWGVSLHKRPAMHSSLYYCPACRTSLIATRFCVFVNQNNLNWPNDDPVHRHKYAALEGYELTNNRVVDWGTLTLIWRNCNRWVVHTINNMPGNGITAPATLASPNMHGPCCVPRLVWTGLCPTICIQYFFL